MSYDSLTDDIRKHMKENNIDRAIILGHSMGGKVGMQLALESPELVEKLVVVDTAPVVYAHITGLMKTIQRLVDINIERHSTEVAVHDAIRKQFWRVSTVQSSIHKNTN